MIVSEKLCSICRFGLVTRILTMLGEQWITWCKGCLYQQYTGPIYKYRKGGK